MIRYIPKTIEIPREGYEVYSARVYEDGNEILKIEDFTMPGLPNKHRAPESMVGHGYGCVTVPVKYLSLFFPFISKKVMTLVSEYNAETKCFTFVTPIPTVEINVVTQ